MGETTVPFDAPRRLALLRAAGRFAAVFFVAAFLRVPVLEPLLLVRVVVVFFAAAAFLVDLVATDDLAEARRVRDPVVELLALTAFFFLVAADLDRVARFAEVFLRPVVARFVDPRCAVAFFVAPRFVALRCPTVFFVAFFVDLLPLLPAALLRVVLFPERFDEPDRLLRVVPEPDRDRDEAVFFVAVMFPLRARCAGTTPFLSRTADAITGPPGCQHRGGDRR
jgi:hypothetical protein